MPDGVLGWGQSTHAAVWTELVAILPPGFDHMASFGEAEEKMFIETLGAKFAVEAFMDPARVQGCKLADENPVAVIYQALNRSVVTRSRP